MPKLRHIALTTQDVDRTAKFYIEVFGMKEMGKIDDPGTTGCFLSDGDINLAILKFKNDQAAGIERGKDFAGIHHIGFEVEDVTAIRLIEEELAKVKDRLAELQNAKKASRQMYDAACMRLGLPNDLEAKEPRADP